MKVAILLAIVAVAASAPANVRKRFIVDCLPPQCLPATFSPNLAPANVQKRFFLDTLGELLTSVTDIVADLWQDASVAFKTTWNQAKATVEGIAHGIDFDDVVGNLVDLIDSSFSQDACKAACKAGAGAIGLGVAAALAEPACDPLCRAALAFLEERARQGK